MRFLGGDYFPGSAAGERRDYLASLFCACFLNPGDPIPEEDRAIIWERYQRSQHQSGRRMGTGIGLSIVSTILNAHGMKYGVDSDEKETVFWFEVTKADVPQES